MTLKYINTGAYRQFEFVSYYCFFMKHLACGLPQTIGDWLGANNNNNSNNENNNYK